MTSMDIIKENNTEDELQVTFYPPLFLQRRIWILQVLRNEGVTNVLDIGCGEGQLLTVLCQPAPWLTPPPASQLPPSAPPPAPQSPALAYQDDDIPNLHTTKIVGLDISERDLAFAVEGTAPPVSMPPGDGDGSGNGHTNVGIRWEEMEAKVWKGGLEVVNEEFVGVECVVSTEVIEHLPPDILPAFAPTLLGIYHPRLLLITTPSYTFNARFTAPGAAPSTRKGYPDPTGRTNRVFRHDDHKFEWTVEEFRVWCDEVAQEWGYSVDVGSVGRAMEVDEWDRDEELGGASLVAAFRRESGVDGAGGREERGRKVLDSLGLNGKNHELLATHYHHAHPGSGKVGPIKEIGEAVKAKMDGYREAFMRLEELWFEREISVLCGGWIEVLIRAVEECEELDLKRKEEDGEIGMKGRGSWVVELVGGVRDPMVFWPDKATEDGDVEGNTSLDCIPQDWIPGEGEGYWSGGEGEEGWEESTGIEGDVSWNGSEDEEESGVRVKLGAWGVESHRSSSNEGLLRDTLKAVWGSGGGWGQDKHSESSSDTSATGWDGDRSDDLTS